MANYISSVIYLLILVLPHTARSQLTQCCIFCGEEQVTLNRHTKKTLKIDGNRDSCVFKIRALMQDDFIRVSTSGFNLQGSPGCEEQYVEIFHDTEADGLPEDLRLKSLGRWCGQSYARIVDVRGSVVIKYVGNNPFDMSVATIEAAALAEQSYMIEVDSTPAYIYSPGYPVAYPDAVNLTWSLTHSDPLEVINIEALEFKVEEGKAGVCLYDYLTIAPASASSNRTVWCGSTGSRFYQSSTDVHLNFRSDSTNALGGFFLRTYTTSGNHTCIPDDVRKIPATTKSELLPLFPVDIGTSVCQWSITASHTDVINLEVIAWADDGFTCGNRPFEIFDGDMTATRMVSKCGSTRPFGFIRSSGSLVTIISGLKPLPLSAGHLFRIKFSSIYKYYFDPHHKEVVQYRSLVWIPRLSSRTARPVLNLRSDQPGHRCIHVEVQTEWLHQIDGSYMDYVEVYDGTESGSRLMGACSRAERAGMSGTKSTLEVRVKYPDRGFWLAIDTTGNCSGDTEMLTVADTFHSLYFPTDRMRQDNFQGSNVECLWHLRNPSGLLVVDVGALSLQNLAMTQCSNAANYLMAYDGADEFQNKTHVWCGSDTTNVTSLGDLWLKVRVKDFTLNPQFRIKYRNIPHFGCHNVELYAEDEWQYLTSPGFPRNYPNNANCSWRLVSKSPVSQVKVEVIEVSTDNCITDVANIADQAVRSGLTLCGDGYPQSSFQSTGRSLDVTFTTDSHNTLKGFKIAYYNVKLRTPNKQTLTATISEQNLYSPGYPSPYEEDSEWYWLIETDAASVVTIQLEGQARPCRSRNDRFVAYDGATTNDNVLSYFCTSDPEFRIFQSRGPSLLLHLMSAETNVHFGFMGIFTISYHSGKPDRACLPGEMETLTARAHWSELKYPAGHMDYPNEAECVWRIRSYNSTTTVSLEVLESDMESSYTCSYDYVTIYDGDMITSEQIGVFCGSQTPSYKSSSPNLLLVFKSDTVTRGKGFTLRYRITPAHQETEETPQKDQSIGLLVGGTLGGVVLLLVSITLFLCFLGRTRRGGRQRSERNQSVVYNRNNSTMYVVSPVFMGGATSNPPPPYPGVSNPAYSAGPEDLPPAYHEYASSQLPSPSGGQTPNPDISPPPYTASPNEDFPESPPTYETAMSLEEDQEGAGNSPQIETAPEPTQGATGGTPSTSGTARVYYLGPV